MDSLFAQEASQHASTAKGSNDLLCAMWREHPVTMRSRFILGAAEAAYHAEPEPQRPAASPVLSIRTPAAFQLIDHVADDFGLSHGEIIGEGRAAFLVDARSVVVRILRARGWSFPQIGRVMGQRDHSTIINIWAKRDIYERRNPLVMASYNRLRAFEARGVINPPVAAVAG